MSRIHGCDGAPLYGLREAMWGKRDHYEVRRVLCPTDAAMAGCSRKADNWEVKLAYWAARRIKPCYGSVVKSQTLG